MSQSQNYRHALEAVVQDIYSLATETEPGLTFDGWRATSFIGPKPSKSSLRMAVVSWWKKGMPATNRPVFFALSVSCFFKYR